MPHLRKSPIGLILLTLALVLSSCGGPSTSTPSDTAAPKVAITSPGVSVSTEYELTGTAWDDTGIESASFSLNGSDSSLSITAGEFATLLNLQPGENEITVTVADAAGNEGTATRSVRFGSEELVLSTEIAMRGDSIDLGGTFGPGGSVTFGGVPASVSSWSANSISVEVPANAPSGWTDVTVISNSGTGTASLFVGTAYGPGSLDDLVALGLPAGTAVRLAAGTYTVNTTPLVVDGLSLYGEGPDQTVIDTGTAPDALRFRVSTSQDLTLQDLALVTDGTLITPDDLRATMASGPFDPFAFADAFELARALADRSGGQLDTLASRPTLTLHNLEISHKLGASMINFGISDPIEGVMFHGDVIMDDLMIDTASLFYVATSGEIVMTDSTVKAHSSVLIGLGGDIQIERSTIELNNADQTSGVVAQNRLLVDDLTYISRGSHTDFGSLTAAIQTLPATLASSVTNSAFYLIEPNPSATGSDIAGTIGFVLAGSPTYFTDNIITAHRDTTIRFSNGNILVERNTFNNGAAGIAEANVIIGQGEMHIPNHMFRNNTFDWTAPGGLILTGYYGSLALNDNTFVGAEAGTAVTLSQEAGFVGDLWSVSLIGNTFTDFTNAFDITQPTSSVPDLEMVITGNIFDFEFTAAPQVAELTNVSSADIDASGNQWGDLTTAAAALAFVSELGSTPIGTFVIDTVLTP